MTTVLRKGREQALAEREKQFIDATHKQLCKEGLLGIQMAAIARSCNYATGTLYHHFASKEDLLIAVCSSLTGVRQSYCQRVADSDLCNRDKMFGFLIAYSLFSQHHPEHFRLEQYILTEVVWQAASEERRKEYLLATQPVGEMVEAMLKEAMSAGEFESHGKTPFAFSIGSWSMAMGMHTLMHAGGLLEHYNLGDPSRMLLRNIQLQLNGIGWAPMNENPFDDADLDARVADICRALFADLCEQHGCLRLGNG